MSGVFSGAPEKNSAHRSTVAVRRQLSRTAPHHSCRTQHHDQDRVELGVQPSPRSISGTSQQRQPELRVQPSPLKQPFSPEAQIAFVSSASSRFTCSASATLRVNAETRIQPQSIRDGAVPIGRIGTAVPPQSTVKYLSIIVCLTNSAAYLSGAWLGSS